MPAYRFSWDLFDDVTVAAIAYALDDIESEESREWLNANYKRPTPDLVRKLKDVLVRTWLPKYPGTQGIVERLIDAGIGPMGRPRSADGYARYIDKCRNSKRLRQYICEAMIRFGDQDRDPEDANLDFTRRFASLEPNKQTLDPRKPHAYQQEAWNKLNAHLAESQEANRFQGLVVMPTGSGKTFTAVRWLLTEILSNGGRILWLAHRHELLSQAAAEFHHLTGFVSGKERVRVRIVSGAHCSSTMIDPADDIIVASIHSLARRMDITEQLLKDKKLFVVIDEAHHAPATSYTNIIEQLKSHKRWQLLGLTATPTRTDEAERPILSRLFGGNVLVQVDIRDLIAQKMLARPIPIIVKTDADVEDGITKDDLAHYGRFKDLSDEWLDRIAQMAARNAVIIDHYIERQDKYGRTLVFAINVPHAALLVEQLKGKGVNADYVASYRPDGTEGNPSDVIEKFRTGEIDVLVNVQMVTEGVDVPSIKTVFLTRPTSSEILMRQMIGRALRGPAAGGSDEAYLVSFLDHWEKFRDWDSPFELVPDIMEAAGEDPGSGKETEEPKEGTVGELSEHYPWEVIKAIAKAMKDITVDLRADAFDAVPHGYFLLEREDEDEGVLHRVDVFEHQLPCWNEAIKQLHGKTPEILEEITAEEIYDEYFSDCDVPAPGFHQIGLLHQHFIQRGEVPKFYPLKGRDACDPYRIAKAVFEKDMGRSVRKTLVEESYTPLARSIYTSLRDFNSAVDDALHELEHPEDSTRRQIAVPVFEPLPDQKLTEPPKGQYAHELESLMKSVLAEGAELIDVPRLEYAGKLQWSKRLLKGWYGMAYYGERPPRIVINRLLNSPEIDEGTIRFLLWHEFLHVYLKQKHTKTFRELERVWPGIQDADHQLDILNERFGVQYW